MSKKVENSTNAQPLTVCNMLCAFDLRIGNLIKFADMPSKVLNVSSTAKFDNLYIEHDEGFEWTEFSRCKGLELTEDWLISLGFEKIYNSEFTLKFEFKKYNNFEVAFNLVDNYIIARISGNTLRKIKYIHELQNLYFALTSKELRCA
jgi:mRNA-degrading endonuclease HigB of HigAB toxin-antitoxin module